jgi:hypothetical protein
MDRSKVFKVVFAFMLALSPAILPELTHAGLLSKARAMRMTLQDKGYRVRGQIDTSHFAKFDISKLYCQGTLPSCNGNNFNAPYLVAEVPQLPGQAAPSLVPYSFRLRGNEAVVLLGPTPPPCDYYSYVCFLFNRYEQGWGPAGYHKILSSLGDPLNRFTMKAGPVSFSQNTVLIFTPDRNTAKAVWKAARAVGFSPGVINTFVIPHSLYKTNNSLDKTTDELIIAQRTALWKDGTKDGSGYLDSPGVVVFRVTPPARSTADPFPVPKQRVRGTGVTEFNLIPAVDALREAILAHYSGLSAQEILTDQAVPESPLAIQTMTNTLGDSRDAVYLLAQDTFKLSNDPNDFLIVYGVNHEKSRKAVYQNVNIYRAFKLCGVASAFSHCNGNPSCVSLEGAAGHYFSGPSGVDVDKLYALKVARNCGGDPRCLQIPTGGCGEGAEINDDLIAAVRAYVDPKTKIGPNYTELLFDRIIHFTPSASPTLQLTSKWLQGVVGKPVEVPFSVSSAATGDVRWEVKIEYLDDSFSGRMKPNQGIISGGSGDASFVFTADYPGIYSMVITVTDHESRIARTEIKINLTAS